MSQTNTLIAISIHSLVKRETGAGTLLITGTPNFNPLPRKEGDNIYGRNNQKYFISIHSLVKRETHKIHCDREKTKYFNPLPRKEGDLNLFWMPDDTLISIHSLVKRETRIMCRIGAMRTFQSTPS